MTSDPMKNRAITNPIGITRFLGLNSIRTWLYQACIPTAVNVAPVIEVIASHRHGNWTSASFGKIAHSGLLNSVVMKSENNITTPTAFKWLNGRLRLTRAIAGNEKPMTASASKLPYQLFRFV